MSEFPPEEDADPREWEWRPWLPWIAGIGGGLLVLLALTFGILAWQQAGKVGAGRAELADRVEGQAKLLDGLAARLDELEESLSSLQSGVEEAQAGVERLDRQKVDLRIVQQGYTEAMEERRSGLRTAQQERQENRAAINRAVAQLNELRGELRQARELPGDGGDPATTAGTRPTSRPAAGISGNGQAAPASLEEMPRAANGRLYTIQPGDTLSRIAARYQVTLRQMLTANPGINPTRLQIGQQIVIPVMEAAAE
jgi:nucleoid-associated protein YgaU